MSYRLSLLSGLALAIAVSLGCNGPTGPPTFDVKGKVTMNGEPMKVKTVNGMKLGTVKLWVVKQDGADPLGKREAAVKDDGTFVFEGLTKPLAGKHKVCVEWKDDFSGPDKLGKKFDEKNSKIVRTFPEDKEITIDVSKPEG